MILGRGVNRAGREGAQADLEARASDRAGDDGRTGLC